MVPGFQLMASCIKRLMFIPLYVRGWWNNNFWRAC